MKNFIYRFRHPFPLSWHLLVLVAGTLIPLAGFATYMVLELAQAKQADEEQNLLQYARNLAIAIDQEIDSTVRTLMAISTSIPKDGKDLESFHRLLRQVMQTQPSWRTLILSSASGQPLLSATRPFGSTLHGPFEPLSMRDTLTSQRVTIGKLAQGNGGHMAVPVRVPIVDDDGLQFILTAAISADSFQNIAMRVPIIGSNWVRTIVDSGGSVVARSRSPEVFIGTRASADFIERTNRQREAVEVHTTLDGEEVYLAHSHALVSKWVAAVAVPVEVIATPARRSIVTGAAVGLLLLVVFSTLTLFHARGIARSIEAITAAAQALASGKRPDFTISQVSEVVELNEAMQHSAALLIEREEERNALLERKDRARQEAEAANEAKDRFLAMLGHELRNPLGAASNGVFLLRQILPLDAESEEIQSIVERQLKHLTRLLDDLLDASRITRGKIELQKEELDLTQVIKDLLSDHQRLFGDENVRLQSHVPDHPIKVYGDRTRINQAVSNLLMNSLKFTPAGGEVVVRLENSGSCAKISVIDTGCGIDPAILPTLFELFTQGPQSLGRTRGGLGLGLAVAKGLVELHGGSLAAHSLGEGKGTTMTIELPTMGERLKSEASTVFQGRFDGSNINTRDVRGRTILVVEDIVDAAKSLKLMLTLQGHNVKIAHSGKDALELAPEYKPEIIICDIGLPDMSGYEVCKQVRSFPFAHGILIIALSGYGQKDDIRQAHEAGFDHHLTKPVDPQRLSKLIGH